MMEDNDPTMILKSIKDLNKFLAKERNAEKLANKSNGTESSPRLKLSFSETMMSCNNSSSSNDFDSFNGSSFAKKHQQSIAGFDITKKIREKDSQILEAKSTIAVLESKYQNLLTSHKKDRIQHDTEIDNLRRKQHRDKDLNADLEVKVKQLQTRDQEMKEELIKVKKLSETNGSQMEKKMLFVQTANLEKTEKLHEELTHLRERVTLLENETEEKSSMLNFQEVQNAELEDRIASMHKRLIASEKTQLEMETMKRKMVQMNSLNKELELRLEELKDQENKLHMFEITIKQLPDLKHQILKLKEENSMLKITRVNIDLLKEKLSSAESQLKVFEGRCRGLTAENATLVTLRDMSEQYESVLRKELDMEYMPPVADFIEILRELKKKDDVVATSLTELKASLESHTNSKEASEELVKNLKSDLKKSDLEVMKKAHIIRRFQRKTFLLSKERDNLKDIIASYESESTINPSALEQQRISRLESQLEGYKDEVSKLEEELNQAQRVEKYRILKTPSEDNASTMDGSQIESQVRELEAVIASLSEENEHLKAQLEHHSVKGSYDPSQTKVLHFKDNPLEKAYQDRLSEQQRLIKENEALKQRVILLEKGDTLDITQKVGVKVDEASSKQMQELEEKATSLETRNKRLIDAFKLKSQEMREVVYRLTGYRVDLRGDNHYRLSNLYSESQEDYLLFEQTQSGDLQLLETPYSGTLEGLINSYLRHDHSYPAFLSALTLELFGRQSMNQSSSEQEEEEFEGGEEEEDMGEEEEEEMGEEDIGEEEDEERPTKRMRRDEHEHEEEEDEEEDDDDDELICLD